MDEQGVGGRRHARWSPPFGKEGGVRGRFRVVPYHLVGRAGTEPRSFFGLSSLQRVCTDRF